MGCTKRDNRVSYGGLLVAQGEHSLGPEISGSGETDEIDHGDGAKVVKIELVVRTAVEIDTKPYAREHSKQLAPANDALDWC